MITIGLTRYYMGLIARCYNHPISCTRKGDLQRAFPLDVLMVPSCALAVIADGEHLTCGGFSLGETIHLGNFEFIADYFSGTSLSP
jgi:hypothetical protein